MENLLNKYYDITFWYLLKLFHFTLAIYCIVHMLIQLRNPNYSIILITFFKAYPTNIYTKKSSPIVSIVCVKLSYSYSWHSSLVYFYYTKTSFIPLMLYIPVYGNIDKYKHEHQFYSMKIVIKYLTYGYRKFYIYLLTQAFDISLCSI
jgi:hypothetical protein